MAELYDALIESIRREDTDQFLERYLQGPEQVRAELRAAFQRLQELADPARCPAKHLPYLAELVGLGGELSDLVRALPEQDLRKAIPLAVPLWHKKGLPAGLLAVVRLLTGRPAELSTWFDRRWILEESELAEDLSRTSTWLLDAPGGADRDEYTSELTVVDEGDLNRPLLRTLVELVRPVGERVLVRYVDLLEDFSFGKAHLATVLVTLRGTSDVRGGRLVQAAQTLDLVRTVRSSTWQGYLASFRGRLVDGGELSVRFASSEDGANGYRLMLIAVGVALLERIDTGVYSVLAVRDRVAFGRGHDVTIRVLLHPDGSDRIRIDLDGEVLFDLTEATHRTGTVGVEVGPSATSEWDRIEVFELPLDMDLVAPPEVAA